MEVEASKAIFDKIIELDILPAWFPNVSKDTNGDELPTTNHCRVTETPIDKQRLGVGCGKGRKKWIVQILIAVREGEGSIKAKEYADLFDTAIPANTSLTNGAFTFKTVGDLDTSSQGISSVEGWYYLPTSFTMETIA